MTEAFDLKDGKLNFKSDTGIKSSFGKGKALTPYTKKILGDDLISYSLYNANTDNSTDIMKAIKSADMTNDDVKEFLNRTAIYAARVLRGLKVDVIVTPVSSSPLTKEFVKEISRRTNYDVYTDSFRKVPDFSKIRIDTSHPGLTDKIKDSMEKIIDRATRRGNLSVKMFAPQHRKFITNLFEVVVDKKLFDKIVDKHVVIIDDIMTSGTTAKNIYDVLRANGAEKVSALTIFKST